MAVVLRFARTGTACKPSYRIVATDKENPRDGRYLEVLGHHNPKSKACVVKKERVKYWLDRGARSSETVNQLLVKNGVV